MSLFNTQQLRSRAQARVKLQSPTYNYGQTIEKGIITESIRAQLQAPATKVYDIFLSHSTNDAEEVLGLKLTLEDLGYSVYVDWIEDPQLDRSNVTKATADKLRERMKSCKSLFYAYSVNATNSKWMPWELGYFDALKDKAAVLPIRAVADSNDTYTGSEYLGLYYYISFTPKSSTNNTALWVNETASKYTTYEAWVILNAKPVQH
jgi:hypothetical protein